MRSAALAAHYARLGLSMRNTATREEVVAAYRAEALRVHPDQGGCSSSFAALTASYEAALAHIEGTTRVYNPASMRSHGTTGWRGGAKDKENTRLIAGLMVPVVSLAAISIKLVYSSKEGVELRAGGTSRYRPIPGDDAYIDGEIAPSPAPK